MECKFACVVSWLVHNKRLVNFQYLTCCQCVWTPLVVPIFSIGLAHLSYFYINFTGRICPNLKPYSICMSLFKSKTTVSHLNAPSVLPFVKNSNGKCFITGLPRNIDHIKGAFSSAVFTGMPWITKSLIKSPLIQKVVFIRRQSRRIIF